MFKTLAALAVAMTATTALLGWVDPSVPLPDFVATVEDVLPVARDLVADGLGLRSAGWRTIEVASIGENAPADRMLAAAPHRRDHHFAVDRRGRVSNTRAWREQAQLIDTPNTIRIRLMLVNDGAEPTPAQLSALRALVLALDEAVGSTDIRLAVTARRG